MSETKNTFPSLVNRYLLDYLPLKRNTTPNTIIAYQNSFQTFKEFIEVKKHKKFINLEMEDFTREFLFDYVTWLKEEKGNSDGTCHLRLSAIKAFLQYCSDENPAYCLQCKEAKTVRIKRIQPDISKLGALPPEKIERLLSAPDPSTPIGLRDQCLLRLLYQTGCRINEVLSLKLRDLIRRNKMVTLRIYGKGGKYRTVPLVKSTTKILDKYLNSYHPENNLDDLVFYSFRKGIKTKLSQNTVGYRLDKYCQLLHEKDPSFPEHIHAHQLRHSIATTLYKQGVDITTIRDLLGHASVETTKIYAKSDLTMIKEALDKVEVTEKNASQKKIWKGKEEFIKKLWQ